MSEERGEYRAMTVIADPVDSLTNTPAPSRGTWTAFRPGDRFGRLVVLERAGSSAAGLRLWLCRCDCGATVRAGGAYLRAGRVISCGCSSSQRTFGERRRRHGKSHTRIYYVWQKMIERCERPTDKRWSDYGGRGVRVCPEWHDFVLFYRDMGDPPVGCSLDRIDVDGGYCKANCRWATASEQGRNQRRNRVVEIGGERLCLADAYRRYGISKAGVQARLRRGWTLEDALTRPVANAGRAR